MGGKEGSWSFLSFQFLIIYPMTVQTTLAMEESSNLVQLRLVCPSCFEELSVISNVVSDERNYSCSQTDILKEFGIIFSSSDGFSFFSEIYLRNH